MRRFRACIEGQANPINHQTWCDRHVGTRLRRNAAQDGAAAAQSRVLHHRRKSFERDKLRHAAALTALGAESRAFPRRRR